MLSNRSHNTEYTNSANPFGYHLGQGTLFSYVNGYEYRDIEAAWDWNLIPGTTSVLGSPKLNSSYAGVTGKKSFVGVVSDGWVGTSVEDYVDPHDGNIAYRKAWFFLDDSVVVSTTNLQVNESVPGVKGRPAVTVLDNRLASDDGVWVDAEQVDASNGLAINGSTLYYGGNGYLSYDTPFSLTLSEQNRTGNWSAISTSTKGNTTVPIFSAYTGITSDSHTYAFFPASTQERLAQELHSPTTKTLEWNGTIGVAGAERLALVFWPGSGVTATTELRDIGWGEGQFVVTSQQPAAYLFATRADEDGTKTIVVTLADPSQSLERLEFSLEVKQGTLQCSKDGGDCTAGKQGVSFSVEMPAGGMAGSSVFREVVLA
ncbi:hypothetical protein EHS25_003390 [Saitozyma podzolica]|uniref:Polysaccharide lyase family 8 central domain-containing protein n=1 Tax=Saitozyma podzolica TaxID=1890683 RepID=A0A427Y8M6_9TREE|nr:hypothetical protein EHS25_003390 [Saitozyma podzolica]